MQELEQRGFGPISDELEAIAKGFALGFELDDLVGWLKGIERDLLGRGFQPRLERLTWRFQLPDGWLLNYYGRRYWVNIVRMTSIFIPVSQLLIGLAGVCGYLNLAWAGARHLLGFIAVLLGWLLSQQLLNDLAAALKQRAFKHSREVWLATCRVVEPPQRVLGGCWKTPDQTI